MHNPADPSCPRNADPRNETCGCRRLSIVTYHSEARTLFYIVESYGDDDNWTVVRTYQTREEAREFINPQPRKPRRFTGHICRVCHVAHKGGMQCDGEP